MLNVKLLLLELGLKNLYNLLSLLYLKVGTCCNLLN